MADITVCEEQRRQEKAVAKGPKTKSLVQGKIGKERDKKHLVSQLVSTIGMEAHERQLMSMIFN